MEIVNFCTTRNSHFPNGSVISFTYKKPGCAGEPRALIVRESDGDFIAGDDLIRSVTENPAYRNFKKDRIVGHIIFWGTIEG